MSSPAFRIVLHRTEHGNYTSGDVVRGVVVLQSKLDEPVGRAAIQFIGQQTFVRGRGSQAREITTTLFNHSTVLYESHYTLRANTPYEWPFEFTFPELYRPTAMYAEDDSPEPLPPSMYDEEVQVEMLHICSVRYNLVATLSRPPDAHLTKGYETKARLAYVLPPSIHSSLEEGHKRIVEKQFEVKAPLASATPERRRSSVSSITQKTLSKLKVSSNSVPYTFELAVTTFDHICIGQTMPLSISVRQLPGMSNDCIPPEVTLKEIWPTVRGITTVTLRDVAKCGAEGLKCEAKYSYSDTAGQGFNEFIQDCDYSKEFDFDIFWGVATVPTFSSANISRAYLLKFIFTIACAGKSFRMEVQHPLTILPEQASGSRGVAVRRHDMEFEAPPVYATNHIPSDPLPNYRETMAEEPRPPAEAVEGQSTSMEATLVQLE